MGRVEIGLSLYGLGERWSGSWWPLNFPGSYCQCCGEEGWGSVGEFCGVAIKQFPKRRFGQMQMFLVDKTSAGGRRLVLLYVIVRIMSR